jgi:hypothetical protein
MTLDDGTILHVPPLQKRKPVDANNNNLSSNAVVEESSTKKLLLPPNRPNPQVTSSLSNRPRRRRREMQAITMIIETKEFPYNDDYVWKNNGNTIHKSTGQKSIYYKCSNSIVVSANKERFSCLFIAKQVHSFIGLSCKQNSYIQRQWGIPYQVSRKPFGRMQQNQTNHQHLKLYKHYVNRL